MTTFKQSKLWRAVGFVMRNMRYNAGYMWRYAIGYCRSGFLSNVLFYDHADIPKLLQQGKTIIRFGDGEVYLLNYGSIHYQTYDPAIRETYLQIIAEYSASAPYVLSINEGPMRSTNSRLRRLGLLQCWLPMKVVYERWFDKQTPYLDASLFYDPDTIPRYLVPFLTDKHVIVATREDTIKSISTNEQHPLQTATFIKTPDFNSFAQYDTIMKSINEAVKNNSKPPVVLLAVGPASKVMAFSLATAGIQTIDVGIGLEIAYTKKDLSALVLKAPEN